MDEQDETKMMIDIHKFSPNEKGLIVGRPLKKIYIGGHSG